MLYSRYCVTTHKSRLNALQICLKELIDKASIVFRNMNKQKSWKLLTILSNLTSITANYCKQLSTAVDLCAKLFIYIYWPFNDIDKYTTVVTLPSSGILPTCVAMFVHFRLFLSRFVVDRFDVLIKVERHNI